MAKSKLNSFIKRAMSALVLAPVVIYCIIAGKTSISLLALGAAALLSWEWANMFKGKSEQFFALSYLLSTVAVVVFSPLSVGLGVILFLSVVAYWRFYKEKDFYLKLLGLPYISIGIGSLVLLYNTYGYKIVLWYMIVVWGVDIGGYLFGSWIKGPKLAPKISPNKTWAGLFGGAFVAVLTSLGACMLSDNSNCMINTVILAVIITCIAQTGDLIESAIKRHLNIKDSSNLIPGHGGIFDRIDGLIFAAPFTYGLLKILDVNF